MNFPCYNRALCSIYYLRARFFTKYISETSDIENRLVSNCSEKSPFLDGFWSILNSWWRVLARILKCLIIRLTTPSLTKLDLTYCLAEWSLVYLYMFRLATIHYRPVYEGYTLRLSLFTVNRSRLLTSTVVCSKRTICSKNKPLKWLLRDGHTLLYLRNIPE